jgi:HSP20 family protein
MSMPQNFIRVAIGRPPQQAEDHSSASKGPAPSAMAPLAVQTPLIDIHEGPAGLILEADLPGATEEGISVQLEDNVLSLYAQVTSPTFENARLIHEEYRAVPYQRSFILSDEVDRSQISAAFKNGVLRLSLPRTERLKTRRIEIKTT